MGERDVGNVDKAIGLEAHVYTGSQVRAQEPTYSAVVALTQVNPGLLCSWLQLKHSEAFQSLQPTVLLRVNPHLPLEGAHQLGYHMCKRTGIHPCR